MMTTTIAFKWNKNSYFKTQEFHVADSGSETVITNPSIPLLQESILNNLKTTLVVNTNYYTTGNVTTIQETYSFETYQSSQAIGNLFIVTSYEQPKNPENPTFTNVPSLSAYVSSKGIFSEWNNTLGVLSFNNKTGERLLQLYN